jgi:beclin 1
MSMETKCMNTIQPTMWLPICQICGTLLKIDNSIEQINDVQYRQLSCSYMTRDDVDTVTTISDADMETSMSASIGAITASNLLTGRVESSMNTYFEPIYSKSMPPKNFYNPNMTISMTDSEHNQNTNELLTGWSTRINTISSLFDIMSTNSTIDHPLCEECADQLINQLDVQCKIVQKEQSEYSNLINKLNQENLNENEVSQLENELEALELEERELLKKLNDAEIEEAELEEKVEKKLSEEEKLIEEEEKLMIEYCNYKSLLINLEEKQSSLDNQIKQNQIHYNRLRTTNVLNAAFHIWHSGPFGTINYFRLGRLPDTPVEWDEINAALGQVALLLHSLARKVRLEFKRYRLVPFGNYSYIEVIENVPGMNLKKNDQLHMYGSGGFKYYWGTKFDVGMVAFLDCLKQFEDKIRSIDNSFSMPYPISVHKLEDKKTSSSYSIKCQINSYEEWTKALKCKSNKLFIWPQFEF